MKTQPKPPARVSACDKIMLDFAALEIRMTRKALSDCTDALSIIQARDMLEGRRLLGWQRNGVCSKALRNAQRVLKPRGVKS